MPKSVPAVAATGAKLVIAIDGPVASGKTVVGRELARRLGWRMLDTGIMYRAFTWYALEQEIDLADHVGLADAAAGVQMAVGDAPPGSLETASITIAGLDATPHLREPHVEASVSTVAAVPGVREQMVAQQRQIALQGRIVLVGRDIGTVVVPDAALKVYLTATAEVRATRRATEMRDQGREVSDAVIRDEIVRRDGRDENRDVSPLRAARGAIKLDTTSLEVDEVVDRVIALARRRLPELVE